MSAATVDPGRRYRAKAAIVVEAWRRVFGVAPSGSALVLAMSVAEFETHLGDARGWGHNWGALQKRALRADEAATLQQHGIDASNGEAALAAARALLPAGSDEELHLDTSPGRGRYFVWFWAFPDDARAAMKFVEVLVGDRPPVRAVIDAGDVHALAAAMYATHYFEGFHADDPEANVRDYANALAPIARRIAEALGGGAAGVGKGGRGGEIRAAETELLVGGFLLGALGLSIARRGAR